MAHIAIQQLKVTWFKSSRGGDGARRRGELPEALILPPEVLAADEAHLHLVRFHEYSDYRPRVESDGWRLDCLASVAPGLELEIRGDDELAVRFLWTARLGAPPRANGRREVLSAGRWCRLRWNGRAAYEDTWAYEDVICNIALKPADDFIFLHTQPAFSQDHRAHLW